MLTADAPRGFRRAGSSLLIVPASLERHRQVWTRDEFKSIDRTIKLLNSRGVKVTMTCKGAECHGDIERVDGDDPILRCDCTDRVFTRAF
jgi:hypothetical protein